MKFINTDANIELLIDSHDDTNDLFSDFAKLFKYKKLYERWLNDRRKEY